MAANEMHAIDATVAIPLTLRNSIFHSPNDLDIVTLFNPLVQSEGGNLFSDGSALSFGTADDTSQVDPLFTGVMPYPYQLQDISPAINLGVAYQGFSPSSIDILGNPRIQGNGLDAGAFENDIALFLRQRILDHTGLTIYPNPVQEAAHITLENDWQGEIQVRIFSASGKQVFQDQFTKHQAKASWTSTHLTLPAGAYQLVLSDGKRALSTSLIKP